MAPQVSLNGEISTPTGHQAPSQEAVTTATRILGNAHPEAEVKQELDKAIAVYDRGSHDPGDEHRIGCSWDDGGDWTTPTSDRHT